MVERFKHITVFQRTYGSYLWSHSWCVSYFLFTVTSDKDCTLQKKSLDLKTKPYLQTVLSKKYAELPYNSASPLLGAYT